MKEKSSVEFRLTVPDLSIPERIQDGRHVRAKTAISTPILKLFFPHSQSRRGAQEESHIGFGVFQKGAGPQPQTESVSFPVRTLASGVSIPMFLKVLNLIPGEFSSSDKRRDL